MPASIQPFSQFSVPRPPLTISYRLLLGLYAIVPICLLLQGCDQVFWDGYLQTTLPSSPKHYLLLQLLFGTPHIIASSIMLGGNADYMRFYKPKLLGMTVLIVLFFGIGSLFIPYKILYCITAIWTVYHVLKQQQGVARGVCKLPVWAFCSLLTLSVSAGVAIYLGIFLKNSLSPTQVDCLQGIAASLCLSLIIITVVSQRLVKTGIGRAFLWANTLLVLSSFYAYVQQYYFLAILAPRLVHDTTAFIVYATHDYNRHHNHPTNSIYRWANHLHFPIFLVLPVLAFGVTFILQSYGDQLINMAMHHLFDVEVRKAATLGIIGYLSLMHYYTEGFVWKQGSPCRQFVGFKN